jgi:hypothetical protein
MVAYTLPKSPFQMAASLAAPEAGAATGYTGKLDFLIDLPVFRQLCQVAQQQPDELVPLLQSIAQEYPQLGEVLRQNPSELLQLLNEGIRLIGSAPLSVEPQGASLTEKDTTAIENVGLEITYICKDLAKLV